MSQKVRQRICGDYSPLDIQIGFRIHLKRVLAKISEEQLAGILRVTVHAISDYEEGKKPISASMLYHISQTFKIPISNFFDSFSDAFDLDASLELVSDAKLTVPDSGQEQPSVDEQSVVRLLEAFNSVVDPEVQKRVIDLMKMLAEDEDAAKVPKSL